MAIFHKAAATGLNFSKNFSNQCPISAHPDPYFALRNGFPGNFSRKKLPHTMTKDFLSIAESLRRAGLVLEGPCADVPYFNCGVQAGLPHEPGDYEGEMMSVPRAFAENCMYSLLVRGESMRDYDLREGDRLLVRIQDVAESGDMVIASIDGAMTVKAYYEDEREGRWLVPGNTAFLPISLGDAADCRIIGRVMQIIHEAPRAKLSECARLIRQQQGDSAAAYGRKDIERAIAAARSYMDSKKMGESRAWFPVYRVFVDRAIIMKDDYVGFQSLLQDVMGDEAPVLNVRDMRANLDVQSFSRPVSLWNASDAPVTIRRFFDYLEVARRTTVGLRGEPLSRVG